MLAVIPSRRKQTVAYYFTSDSVKGNIFKKIIIEIISKAEALGLKVNSVTSDMGACNKAMWGSFGIHCLPGSTGHLQNSTVHPCDSNRELYFLPDVPNLFKNIKQALFNNKFITLPEEIVKKHNLTSNIVDSKHIEQLANHQNNLELKLIRNLDSEDLQKPNHFDKMKISKAANIVSTDASASLQFLVDHENYHSSFKTTAWFIQQVAKWFTLMTSRSPVVALSKFNLEKYNKTIQFLHDFMDMFKNIKIGSKGTWKPCQAGVLLATKSIIDLQNIFLNEKSYKFLLTGRFSQDCLENLFSCIRSVQPIPNSLQFKCNLKLVCVAQFLKNVSNSSNDQDDREFLGDILDFSKVKPVLSEPLDEEPELCDGFNDSTKLFVQYSRYIYFMTHYLIFFKNNFYSKYNKSYIHLKCLKTKLTRHSYY